MFFHSHVCSFSACDQRPLTSIQEAGSIFLHIPNFECIFVCINFPGLWVKKLFAHIQIWVTDKHKHLWNIFWGFKFETETLVEIWWSQTWNKHLRLYSSQPTNWKSANNFGGSSYTRNLWSIQQIKSLY